MSIVKKEDTWDADMYDDKHGFVSEYGKDLISLDRSWFADYKRLRVKGMKDLI